jgi:hypothetical protein
MNTAIKHVPYIEYCDETHEYFIDGELVPSITQTLKEVGAINTDYFTEEHARRGTLVHSLTEMFDTHEFTKEVGAEKFKSEGYSEQEMSVAARYAAQWLKLRENVPFKIEEGGIEEKVFDPLHCFAGRLDRRVMFNDACVGRALIEIKTNQSGYVPEWTGLQLAAQAHAKEPGELFSRFAFVLTPERYIVHEFPKQEFVNDRDTFLAMLRVVRWKRAHQ